MMDAQRETYREEAQELLTELEAALLELEELPDDQELIGRVFRAMHTIKGSGAMFGFDDVAAFTHEVETVYDLVRAGKMNVGKELVNLSLSACDVIKTMLNEEAVDQAEAKKITSAFQQMLTGKASSGGEHNDTTEDGLQEVIVERHHDVTYRIRIRPASHIFMNGTNPILLLNELRDLGPSQVVAQREAIPLLDDLDPESCYTYWDVILTTSQGVNAIKDVFIFVEDDCDLTIEVIDEGDTEDIQIDYKRIGEILIERQDLKPEDLEEIMENHKPLGERLVASGKISAGKIQSALEEQELVREARKNRQQARAVSSIRVKSDRLDTLVNLVGELVTVQARLSQAAAMRNDPDLLLISEEVERLTAELRDNTMSIRMVPIGSTFSKFKRLVRDLSVELGKEVEMKTSGAETELDKTVIEQLNDPLVHIIRNCIDHAIEPPDVREQTGKPRKGIVHLSAIHSGANVLIQITDDGAGLDKETILGRAIDRGIVAPDADLAEKDIFDLIFAPGFSTAKSITSVSGRGVGMDVVKRAIENLRGSVDVESSKGEGTTVTLKIPLTLAIIDGLLVKIEEEHFVVPLLAVEECIELTRQDVEKTHGRHVANVRGEIVPYVHLREHFLIGGETPTIEQIVINEVNGHRLGLVVDEVVGEHQTVIKGLGSMYEDVEEISGATILGDGTVALIVDVPKLFHTAEREELAVTQRQEGPL